jgi:putative tryptophan/tyrosine transport system substrate-binding protein
MAPKPATVAPPNRPARPPRPKAAMRRRDFIRGFCGSAVGWPLAARAQQTGRARRIGVLIPFENEDDPQVKDLWPAFKQRLAELGWVVGRNIQFDVHFTTQNIDRIRAGAADIAASGPELIYVWSNPGLAAMKQATQTIPVVFVLVSDPVGSGLVANLARPGGNITGFQNFETAIGGKWLELLKEAAPGVRRVGALYNQSIVANVEFLRTAQHESSSVGVTVMPAELHDTAGIEHVVTEFAREPDSGLIVTPNPLNARNTEVIIGLAAQLRLPAIYPFRLDPQKDGLMSYGFDTIEQQRGAADYVDRVLKGEKPADLPVQAPTKYQLVINLKTAKALGLDMPLLLQQRADEIIE